MSSSRFTRSSTYPRLDVAGGALLGDGFVPDAVMDEWVRSGFAVRTGATLALSDGRRFALSDALRILGRRNGDSDPYGLTGRLLTLRSILRRGGLLSPDGVRLGAAIYDVEFGSLTEPLPAPVAAELTPRPATTKPPPSPH